MKIVNYLDVIFNLDDGIYKPYKKPTDEMRYIHVDFDHPPSIIKEIPKSIPTQLSSLSSSKETFHQAKHYEQSRASWGQEEKLTYIEKNVQNHKEPRKRRRNIWFNPPYSRTVK